MLLLLLGPGIIFLCRIYYLYVYADSDKYIYDIQVY